MTSLATSEISLYELTASSGQASIALQVSPVTFKSLVSSLIDTLAEQKIPAIVWAKLPRGDAWQAELDRCCQSEDPPQTVYIFKNQREEPEDKTDKTGNSTTDRNGAVPANSSISVSVQLTESQLRREYFLLIWSEQFCGLLVAQRVRSQQVKIESPSADSLNLDSVQEDPPEKKSSLFVSLSLEPQTILQALDRLQQLTPSEALNWQPHLAQIQPNPLGAAIIQQIFAKQAQRQEDLWQRATTHRKQAETAQLLQLQNEELLNAIRLKDEFLNNVGQELRTPLTNMKTALTLLNSPSLKPPQKQRYMDLLIKECDRQSSLITSLLNLVSLDQMAEQGTIQALRLSEVVPGVVSTYQPLAEEKGVRLAYTVPEDLPPVSCLQMWLKQIVINLLHNGIKFTPRGGQVWVRAKQQGDYVQLEFRDTGIGIAPSEIPKIFDRFYRVRQAVDEDSGGAGLGLTIVQQLLLHCGGSISVKSRISEGSTFNVLLPIHRKLTDKEDE